MLTICNISQTNKPVTTLPVSTILCNQFKCGTDLLGRPFFSSWFNIVSEFYYVNLVHILLCSEYGANYYEVTSHMQIQSPVPWLSIVLQWLQEAQEITQDFIDKVNIYIDEVNIYEII